MLAMDGRKYQIGDYVVDTARYRISSGRRDRPVEPKVFDLLVYLVRHRDRVLTREQLFEAIWDGREVSDATLSNHVKSARRALGDSGELQQTIQTVRGRGYQFVAPVIEVVADATAPAVDPSPASVARPRRRSCPESVARAAAGVWCAGGRALLGWILLRPPAAPVDPVRPYLLVVPFGVSENATLRPPDVRRPADAGGDRQPAEDLRSQGGSTASAFEFRKDKTREHIQEHLPDVRVRAGRRGQRRPRWHAADHAAACPPAAGPGLVEQAVHGPRRQPEFLRDRRRDRPGRGRRAEGGSAEGRTARAGGVPGQPQGL